MLSFQIHVTETADVSPTLETIAFYKYPTRQGGLRNRTQEADGSIPFISTTSLGFFFRVLHQGTLGERFRRQRPVEARDFTSVRARLLNSAHPLATKDSLHQALSQWARRVNRANRSRTHASADVYARSRLQ